MNRPVFNTLEMHRALTSGDFTDRQATTLVASFDSMLRSGVATSDEISELKTITVTNIIELKAELANQDKKIIHLEAKMDTLDAKIDRVASELLVKIGGMMVAIITLAIAAARYFGVVH